MRSLVARFQEKTKTSIVVWMLCFVFSILFVSIFSYATSPVYKNYWGGYVGDLQSSGDASQFITMGKAWSEGQVPYRDFFDHKGPIPFFMNMLGWKLGGKVGIFVLQIISLAVTLFFVYKICSLVSKKILYFFIVSIITLIFLTYTYYFGDSVQEWALPFLSSSIYFISDYLINKEKEEHNPKLALFYGISVGLCLFNQATIAIPILVGILVIGIHLLKNKQFKNFWINILYGVIGILIVFVPFAIYFAANGAFGEFIYCTFIHNFLYANKLGSWIHGTNGSGVIHFINLHLTLAFALIAGILAIKRKKQSYGIFLIASSVICFIMFMKLKDFDHYPMPTLFYLPLFMNELLLFIQKKDQLSELIVFMLTSLLMIFCFNEVTSKINSTMDIYNAVRSNKKLSYEILMDRNFDKIKDSSFMSYGDNMLKDVYLKYDLPLSAKYYAIQDWYSSSSSSEKVYNETTEQFNSSNIKYILVEKPDERKFINIVNERYEVVDSEDEFYLYELKPE